MSENPVIHVWITKYAFTQGVFEADVEHCVGSSDKMVAILCPGRMSDFYHKPHWHTTKEEADAQVRKMADTKIKSLRKSLKKIEQIRANYATDQEDAARAAGEMFS